MAKGMTASSTPGTDQKAAQIIVRSFWEMQHGNDATDAACEENK